MTSEERRKKKYPKTKTTTNSSKKKQTNKHTKNLYSPAVFREKKKNLWHVAIMVRV